MHAGVRPPIRRYLPDYKFRLAPDDLMQTPPADSRLLMSTPRLLSSLATAILSPPVDRYITYQRDRLAPSCSVLTDAARSGVRAYFSEADLDRVRVIIANPLPIADPPLAGLVRRVGFDFPSVALTAAITFDYVVACREPMQPSLLFHELVHVIQYRLLGVSTFAHHYVHGFLSTGNYHDIPLERCAFELEQRFATENAVFNVEAEVSNWFEERRF
jgi:hypothetical protein